MRKIDQDPELFPILETVDFAEEIRQFFPALPEDECMNLSSQEYTSSVKRMSDYFPFLVHGHEVR